MLQDFSSGEEFPLGRKMRSREGDNDVKRFISRARYFSMENV